MLYAAVLTVAIIVSTYFLLVESWILCAASCYVMTLAMYYLQCKVEFDGNNHHTASMKYINYFLYYFSFTHHPLLVQWSRKSRAIPLLPLWAVRPVQNLSACTSAHFTFFTYVCPDWAWDVNHWRPLNSRYIILLNLYWYFFLRQFLQERNPVVNRG